MYNTRHVANLFNLSRETVRKWCLEFGEFLSPTGQGGGKRHRYFTDDDLRVFSFVAQSKKDGATYADITASLKNNARGEIPSDVQMLAVTSPQKDSGLLQRQVAGLTQRVHDLEIELAERRGRESALTEQIGSLQKEIARLNREIGKLEKG